MINNYKKPVYYRGKPLTAKKYKPGTNSHYYSEDEAFEKALDLAKKIGVVRLANITGFDRIGIPVVNTIKPGLKGSSVQHGKGMTLKASNAPKRLRGSSVAILTPVSRKPVISKSATTFSGS